MGKTIEYYYAIMSGFAYLGEAGPWPRKGLEISFFDFAGFKTPRGHFQNIKHLHCPLPAHDQAVADVVMGLEDHDVRRVFVGQ